METKKNILLTLRKIYRTYFKYFKSKSFSQKYLIENNVINEPDKASEIISKIIIKNKPTLITRFGRTEFNIVLNYLSLNKKKINYLDFIFGKQFENWWHQPLIDQICNWSGFFPKNTKYLEKFSLIYLKLLKEIDVIGVVTANPYIEKFFANEIKNANKLNIFDLGGFHSQRSWVKSLENKNVLIIHPFDETIKNQYLIRDKIFKDNYLPNFNLKTIKAVQTIGGYNKNFNDWFEALEIMKNKMSQIDFDIALIGCGAYGFPLAAHAKKIGKIGFHLGGELQLLFGIIGKRYEDPNHRNYFPYKYGLVNKYWKRPLEIERPSNFKNLEDGCYW